MQNLWSTKPNKTKRVTLDLAKRWHNWHTHRGSIKIHTHRKKNTCNQIWNMCLCPTNAGKHSTSCPTFDLTIHPFSIFSPSLPTLYSSDVETEELKANLQVCIEQWWWQSVRLSWGRPPPARVWRSLDSHRSPATKTKISIDHSYHFNLGAFCCH